ncbi:alpha/beta hydrolase [Flavobacterium laiguense]|uniref:Histidine kinase n=1 Tax=Flavobacterium laiguense TaxID=2169409 RepID=A0A2U1K2G6_9FLAO|nr:alpha/beta hydrolase-fold protein [Flavobacterium laiguense]PWA11710.1 histidine kinase [Flavobacterium laiguense]
MKHLLTALLSLITISSFSQIKIENFNSDKLNEKRELVISLPASYEKNPTKKYPLLILLDGDYLLNPFLGTLAYGAYWDDLPEVIIVAISQNKKNERVSDCGSINETTAMPEGKSVAFYDFIALELVPYLQHDYRTTDFRIIAGHDTTAAFLNYFLYNDKPLFNAYISLSPELPLGMEEQIPEILSTLKQPIFYYLSTADGDVKNMQERIQQLDHKTKEIKNPDLNYKFESFKDASHFSLVLHSIPSALYQIFAAAQPISTIEYDTKIVTLKEGYVDYLKKKYDIIENSFGIKSPVRINDIKAIEAAILQNKDFNELDALAIIADKNYPKSMLGDYELATMFEQKGDNPRAVRYYMSGFNKEEIADLTKDMMFAKAEELKKTFAKKPKIKGKVGQEAEPKQETPATDIPVTEEKKQ